MDSKKAATAGSSRSTGKQTTQQETPEQLLDVFKAAALSVTKLYKTSALAESKARSDGYQECLEDLLCFLDKENIGLGDGEGWRIRGWATERLDGRDVAINTTESEDEVEKPERTASPEITRTSSNEPQTKRDATPSTAPSQPEEPYSYTVPSQDNFTFQSSHPYPNIATLDLSDSRSHDPTFAASRAAKARMSANSNKSGHRTSGALGRGAGTKRRWDFDDFFGGCLGGKDPFPPGGKRNRHA